MPVALEQLARHCDTLLEPARFDDYCPNGIQLEVAPQIQRLVTGVTACQALIDAAVALGAEALLVHHGLFWKGAPLAIRGMQARRVNALVRGGVNLLAYHLPLDAHPELGNNARLGQLLNLQDCAPVAEPGSLLWQGRPDSPLPLAALAGRVTAALERPPLTIAAGDRPVQRIAWCSGAAQGYLPQAAALGADAYLSGEISEQTVHQARELGVHYRAAGHHATERYGVQALGAALAARFGLEHRHIDIDNPA
jgi:dinuclear metal center YbgI/SA1388 family protein